MGILPKEFEAWEGVLKVHVKVIPLARRVNSGKLQGLMSELGEWT